MAPHKEYLDDDEAYGGKNGKQPEEISMVPKIGWSDGKGSYGKDDYSGEELHCGAGSFRPGFLQGFKKVWVFALISGMTSLFAEYVHVFLVSQIPYLKRQFDLKDNAINMLTLPSPIASLFTVLFLSVIARRVHIPRALALTSLIAGVCSLLCIIPHLTSHTDLTPPPLKNETTKLTVEKLMFDMPSCVMDRIDPDLIQKTQKIIFQAKMRAMTKAMVENSKKPRAPTPQTKTKDAPTVAAMVASAATTASLRAPKPKPANSDSGGKQPTAPAPTNPTAPPTTVAPTTIVPQGSGVTVIMVDFQKLSKHKMYETLKTLAQAQGIDLDKVKDMDLQQQVEYLDSLGPEVKAMLPSLRMFLGPDADNYFFSYELPLKNRRRRRNADDDAKFEKNRLKLKDDPIYSGTLAHAMKSMPLDHETQVLLFKEACPFNTHPFHDEDHSGVVLGFFVLAMIFHGIAVAPRMAFVVTFIDDNTRDSDTAKHLGVFTALASFGPLIAVLVGFNSMTTYISLEDTSEYMTFLNPRWLPAWWIGFLILGLITCLWSIPTALFPRYIMPSKKYAASGSQGEESCCAAVTHALRGLFPSLYRLMSNGVYLLMVGGATLSHMAWAGITSIIVNYFSHQFSLKPMEPGFMLYSIYGFIVLFGTILGGFVASKLKLSALSCLKMAVGLSVILVAAQGLNIGFGCDQPIINKGLTVDNTTGMTCGQSCSCFDLGYAPVCGSDGITYYSACHAGCGYPHKGKFHDCKCLSDEVKTVTPEFCEQPCMWAYWLFQLVMLIGAFSLGLRFVPLLVSSYRCVDSQDIPVAVGLKMFYVILFSYIAAPYIYKHLEDGTCTLQRPECGIFPTCAIYDIVSYRLRIFVTSFVLELVGALLLLIAFLIGKRPSSKFNERVSDK